MKKFPESNIQQPDKSTTLYAVYVTNPFNF